MRGEIYELPNPRGSVGHEQRGRRYCVVVQNSNMNLSTWLISPTSTSAQPASFRPEIEINGVACRVLTEQTAAIDPQRLGRHIGYASAAEMQTIDAALRIALDLP